MFCRQRSSPLNWSCFKDCQRKYASLTRTGALLVHTSAHIPMYMLHLAAAESATGRSRAVGKFSEVRQLRHVAPAWRRQHGVDACCR